MITEISSAITAHISSDYPVNTPNNKQPYTVPLLSVLTFDGHTKGSIFNLQEADAGGGAAS